MGYLRKLVEEKFLMCLLVLFIAIMIFMNYGPLKNTLLTRSEVFINPFLIALCIMLILKVIFAVTSCDKTDSTTVDIVNIERYNIPEPSQMFGGSKKMERNRDIFLKNAYH
jgi:hypothetical protein